MAKEKKEKKKCGKLKWIIIAVVVLVIIGAAVGGGDDNKVKDVTSNKAKSAEASTSTSTKSETTDPAENEKTEFGVGETAEQKDVQIQLVNATESDGNADAFVTPEDGKKFLILEFEITNNSSDSIDISSIASFEAYCDDYSLNEDYMASQLPEFSGKSQLDGTVSAGKKMNGIIAYQVPADFKNFEVNVTPDFWTTKDIKFVVKK